MQTNLKLCTVFYQLRIIELHRMKVPAYLSMFEPEKNVKKLMEYAINIGISQFPFDVTRLLFKLTKESTFGFHDSKLSQYFRTLLFNYEIKNVLSI